MTLWLGFYALEGWPEDRADYRSAYTSWAVASSNGAKVKLEDFIPNYDPKPDEGWKTVQAHFAALAEQQAKGTITDTTRRIG